MDDYVVLRGFLLQTSCVTIAHAYHNIYTAMGGNYDTFPVYKLISSELSIMLCTLSFYDPEGNQKGPKRVNLRENVGWITSNNCRDLWKENVCARIIFPHEEIQSFKRQNFLKRIKKMSFHIFYSLELYWFYYRALFDLERKRWKLYVKD